jgi:hypothetical protein
MDNVQKKSDNCITKLYFKHTMRTIDWAQMSSFYLTTEPESRLRNAVFKFKKTG